MPEEEFDIKVNLDIREATAELRKYSTILYGTLGLARRMGLPEDVDEMITAIQRLIAQLNMLRHTMILLQTASGPIGWALALLSVTGTVLTMMDVS